MHISHDYTRFFDIHQVDGRLAASARTDFTQGAAALFGRLGVGQERARRIALDLCDRMSAPGRHYHTPVHVLAMFAYADRMAVELAVAEQLAVWFHDAIYDARSPARQNERDSAQLLRDTLLPLRVERQPVEYAADGILWTARHLDDAVPAQHHLLLDLDLAGLSSDTPTFTRQSHAVRAEFRHLPDQEYLRGKIGFFQKLLDRPHIYRTDALAPLESVARTQIDRELRELKQQIAETQVEN